MGGKATSSKLNSIKVPKRRCHRVTRNAWVLLVGENFRKAETLTSEYRWTSIWILGGSGRLQKKS